LLEVKGIDVFYGDAQALWNVSLRVEEGEIVTLLGSNGAGQTTLLKTVSGLLRPRAGSVSLHEKRIDQTPSYEIVMKGIAHIPEGRGLFPNMSVFENITIGAYIPEAWRHKNETMERVFSFFPILRERSHQLAGTLSGGEQQMLTIGRALMARPTLLMLDEPSLGLAPIIVEQIFKIIQEINRQKVTVLLVEQNANIALQVSNRGYVLETGRITLNSRASELFMNEHVKKAYLGLTEDR
jgi:branched-chain amino acid transport system ATP-binding protein